MSTCGCDRQGCRIGPGDPRHGTTNGYTNLGCGCEACRSANADSVWVARRRREAAATPPEVHGTSNGYGNYRCRCAACRAAWAATSLDRLHRQKLGLTDCELGLAPKPTRRRTVQSTEQ